ncbi:MAG: serine/threonine protein phosphatase [Desulfovibrionaceae bacterium]|nr:serine/threonine protein phosphatase [Desulfovibrionaceae bacterium]
MPNFAFNFQEPKKIFSWALGSLILGLMLNSWPVLAAKSVKPLVPATVYDQQPPTTEKELLKFLDLLPRFRAWARANREEAHPSLKNNKPDFIYSEKAAAWVKTNGFEPRRFFCVMGRMAAALVIVEEGYDTKGTRPPDMPTVTESETTLARKHLGKMLQASGAYVAPKDLKVQTKPPVLPKR